MPTFVRVSSLAAAFTLCIGFSFVAVADEAPLWRLNDSVMYLVTKGDKREFRYREPRAALIPFGVTQGTLAFRGVLRDGEYVGTAFKFTRECGALSFPVHGPVLDNGARVRLTGELMQVGAQCQNAGLVTQRLDFRMVKGPGEAPPNLAPGTQDPLSQSEVPLKKNGGGTLVVPVEINEAITLDFIVDSGAADVTVPADVFSTLKRKGTIKDNDFIGEETYVLSDGRTTKSVTFAIKSLKVGGIVLEKVTGGFTTQHGDLLLGQSFLKRFKSWSIDNNKGVLLLELR